MQGYTVHTSLKSSTAFNVKTKKWLVHIVFGNKYLSLSNDGPFIKALLAAVCCPGPCLGHTGSKYHSGSPF